MTEITNESTLDEIKDYVVEGMMTPSGTICPVCERRIKVYKRAFNSGMAIMLMAINKLNPNGYLHINEAHEYVMRKKLTTGAWCGDYGKASHWGMLEQLPPAQGSKKRTSGNWRITDKGKAFVRKEIKVPSHVHLLHDEVVGWSDVQIDITDALNEHFDYNKLMSE